MLIRYLKTIILKKADKIKQPNGTYLDTYTKVKEYRVMKQELTNEVDAEVYGSDINKMMRIKSPKGDLEDYLFSRLNNKEDNVSKYVIFDGDTKYKIVAVSPYRIDIERL